MFFSIERVQNLNYMAAETIFYYILNILYIFQNISYYYCTCEKFQGCQFKNGEEFCCFICQFQLEYQPKDIEKIFGIQKIINIYLSMKEDLTLVHQSTIFDVIILQLNVDEGNEQHFYLKDSYF